MAEPLSVDLRERVVATDLQRQQSVRRRTSPRGRQCVFTALKRPPTDVSRTSPMGGTLPAGIRIGAAEPDVRPWADWAESG